MENETHEEYLARMDAWLTERRHLRKLRIRAWELLAQEQMAALSKDERESRIAEKIALLEAGAR